MILDPAKAGYVLVSFSFQGLPALTDTKKQLSRPAENRIQCH